MKQPIIKILTRRTLHAAHFFTRYTLYAARFFLIGCIISIFVLFGVGYLSAGIDPPHNTTWTPLSTKKIGCGSCHVPRATASSGPALTKVLTNAGLCMSCHVTNGPAGTLPFAEIVDQADQKARKGWSHRWNRDMRAGMAPLNLSNSNPDNPYGLRTYEELPASSVQWVHYKLNSATCSTCHNQHYQTITPWDSSGNVDSGTASGGSTSTVADSTKSWADNQWVDFYVRINSGTSKAAIRQIKSNTSNTLTIYKTGNINDPVAKKDPFPSSIASGNTYVIMGQKNHFLRGDNRANELCVYCHYYRKEGTTGTNVKDGSWDGNKKSHPIVKNLTTEVSDANQFVGPAPLEPLSVFDSSGHIIAQTGLPRYYQNGTGDSNSTNNIVLDGNSRVRCMSCHGIHYTDSDSTTIDEPRP